MSLCKASPNNDSQLFIEPKGDLQLQTSSTIEVQDLIILQHSLSRWAENPRSWSHQSSQESKPLQSIKQAEQLVHIAPLSLKGYHLCVIQFADTKNTQKKKQVYVAGIVIPRRSSEELHICFVSPFVYPVNTLFSDPRNMPHSIQWKEWHIPSVGKLKTNKQAVISKFWFRIRVITWSHPTGHISRCQIYAIPVGNILQCFFLRYEENLISNFLPTCLPIQILLFLPLSLIFPSPSNLII